MKLFGSNERTINVSVASWDLFRGVEVDSPLSRLGVMSIHALTGSQHFRRARLLFLRRDEDSLSDASISSARLPNGRHLGFRRQEIFSTPPRDRRLRNLNMVGNVQNVTVPPFEIFAKKFQISYLASFLSGKPFFKNLQGYDKHPGLISKTKILNITKTHLL